MRRLVAFCNLRKPLVKKVLSQLGSFCARRRIEFRSLDGRSAGLIQAKRKPLWAAGRRPDLAVSLGGDGTLLTAARHVINEGIPMFGINLGGLGFLAAADQSNWPAILSEALEGKIPPKERLALSVLVQRSGKKSHYLALNDCAIRAGRSPRMLDMNITLSVKARPFRLRGDGLIVSTPTGSTAYALSVGGPIIEPGANAILLAPIAPHSLTQRPLVLSSDRSISITLSDYHGEKSQAMVFLDGQLSKEIHSGDTVTVSRYHKPLLLMRNVRQSYFDLLTEKFRWAT